MKYLVEFVDKRDKRKYQYLVEVQETADTLPLIPAAGSTTKVSMEARILRDLVEMFQYVRFSDIEIKEVCSPLEFKEMKLSLISEHFLG